MHNRKLIRPLWIHILVHVYNWSPHKYIWIQSKLISLAWICFPCSNAAKHEQALMRWELQLGEKSSDYWRWPLSPKCTFITSILLEISLKTTDASPTSPYFRWISKSYTELQPKPSLYQILLLTYEISSLSDISSNRWWGLLAGWNGRPTQCISSTNVTEDRQCKSSQISRM